MIVVDTNVVVRFFAPNANSHLAEGLFEKDPDWQVPYLWRSEFRNAMALYLRKGIIAPRSMLSVVTAAEKFFRGKEYMLDSKEIIDCLLSSSCSAYDCEFIALARKLGVPLITMDKKIIKEFPSIAQNMPDFVK